MTDAAAAAAATERYGAIETAYREERWQQVISLGRQLLKDLEPADEPLAQALSLRAQLLMGHAHLHGVGERDAAEDLYRAVLNTPGAEPALRHSAEQGLQQCNRPLPQPAPATEDDADIAAEATAPAPRSEPTPSQPTAQPQPERPQPQPVVAPAFTRTTPPQADHGGGGAAAATPWLAAEPDAPRPSLIAEVVEEPELLEVARADPQQVEEIQLEPIEGPASSAAQQLAASAVAEAMAEAEAARAARTQRSLPLAAQVEPLQQAEPPAATEQGANQPLQELGKAAAAAEAPVSALDDPDVMDDPELLQGLLLVTLR